MIPVATAIAARLLLCGARTALVSGLLALGCEGVHLLLGPDPVHLDWLGLAGQA